MPEWLHKRLLNEKMNKSQRITELVIKGLLTEKEENFTNLKKQKQDTGKSLDSYHSHENAPAFSEFVNIPNLTKGFSDFVY